MTITEFRSTPIEVRDRLDTATFDELAEFILESCQSAGDHARASLRDLIAAGGALVQMRDRMPGQYGKWLDEVSGLSRNQAVRMTRLYTYRAELPDSVFEPASAQETTGIVRALDSIAHLPKLTPSNGSHRLRGTSISYPEELVQRVRELRKAGESIPALSETFQIPTTTIWNWTLTQAERDRKRAKELAQNKQRTAERRALAEVERRRERDQLAKTSGNELSIVYAEIRKALAVLAKQPATAETERASRYLAASEDAIVAAMKAAR